MTKPTYPQRVATALNLADHRRSRSPHAFGTLTFSVNPNNGEVVGIAYRNYAVVKGATLAITIASMAAAINADPFSAVTATAHATTLSVAARRGGWGGAAIQVRTTATSASWGASSLFYQPE